MYLLGFRLEMTEIDNLQFIDLLIQILSSTYSYAMVDVRHDDETKMINEIDFVDDEVECERAVF